ncbi:MAG TPA: hypothetical protein DCQ98_18750 [Planctomycetaceae bacterium]|nr:hypothetical protein [Planctomycetaceae bacterium]HRF00948.1 hypothetical protein [Pirellulaceae bacterium]
MLNKGLGALALVTLVTLSIAAVEIKLDGVKCLMNPNAAVKEATGVAYRDGKVFFCCGNCAAKFKEDPAAVAPKANHQLVQTGQYEQLHCPLSGGDLNPEKTVKVGEVEVKFCCGNCQSKVAEAEGDAQLQLVFGNEAFDKGFAVVKKDEDK